MLEIGLHIGKQLTGVALVCKAIDHRNARLFGKNFHGAMGVGSQHDAIRHAPDHACGIFNRLTATELGVTRRQEDGAAPQLDHSRFKRNAGSGRGLFEQHGQYAMTERRV